MPSWRMPNRYAIDANVVVWPVQGLRDICDRGRRAAVLRRGDDRLPHRQGLRAGAFRHHAGPDDAGQDHRRRPASRRLRRQQGDHAHRRTRGTHVPGAACTCFVSLEEACPCASVNLVYLIRTDLTRASEHFASGQSPDLSAYSYGPARHRRQLFGGTDSPCGFASESADG